MSKIINEDNIDKYRKELKSNFQDSVKSTVLNIIESGYSHLLETHKFTEGMLDEITYKITDNEQLNDYLDGFIMDEIENCIKENDLGEEENEI